MPGQNTDGDHKMISAFIDPSIGFGSKTWIDQAALRCINAIHRRCPRYVDKASAHEVLGTDIKPLFQLGKDIQDRLCVVFDHGKCSHSDPTCRHG